MIDQTVVCHAAGSPMADCDWSDYGQAGCAGWIEIALNIICATFLYFLEHYIAKTMIGVGWTDKTIGWGHHFNKTICSSMFKPTSL